MDGDTNKQSELLTTEITGNHQTAHPAAATVSQPSSSARKFQVSSDYYRKVDRTTDIAGRLPNAVFTLPPRLVQAIISRADVTFASRAALVAVCKKFYLADMQYEESKEVFVDGKGDRSTTVTLDCGRLFAEGYNRQGQCGIGSEEDEVTGPRLIRLPPVLRVWCGRDRWFAKTTRGLYSWGLNSSYMLGIGEDQDYYRVRQPHRVKIDGDVLDVYILYRRSYFRTSSRWHVCGLNIYGELGLGYHAHERVYTPTPLPGSEGVTRWVGYGEYCQTFGFSEDGLLACGEGRRGVGSTDDITTLTPVALPDDVKGRVDRVVIYRCSTFFISGRRCFACGFNRHGQLGIGPDEATIWAPIELPVPVDDIISNRGMTIRSGNTLLACGDNECRQISTADTPKFTTPTPLDLPGPVVKVVVNDDPHEGFQVFVQLTDGAWVGRGEYDSDYFIPVPEADLIDDLYLPGWTPVNDDHFETLNSWMAAVDVMILPNPTRDEELNAGRQYKI